MEAKTSPTAAPLSTPVNREGKAEFKRSINLFTAISLIVGQMVGAGIFISPKGVLLNTGSAGLSLIAWAICGAIAMGSALCFAELSILTPESGSSWSYIRVGIGGGPAFIEAWVMMIGSGGGTALLTLVCAESLLSPFIDDCSKVPYLAKMLAIWLTMLIIYINSSNSRTQRLVKVFFFAKLGTMVTVVIGGFYYMASRGLDNLKDPFEGTAENGWGVAISFYSGLFAYHGWQNVTFVTEEVKNPKRNMPLSIFISVTMVIVLYILMNISYHVVLGTDLMLESNIVLFEWAKAMQFGIWAVLFSFMVAVSTFGSSLGSTFSIIRQFTCLAREGHTIKLLAMIDVENGAPLTALMLRGVIVFCFILTSDGILTLLNFLSFLSLAGSLTCFVTLIKLKITRYNEQKDGFRLPLAVPIIMAFVYVYLILVPIISKPSWFYLYAVILAVGGLVFYIPFVRFNITLPCFDRVTTFMQLLFKVAEADKNI